MIPPVSTIVDRFGSEIAALSSSFAFQFSDATNTHECLLSSLPPAAFLTSTEYLARRAALGVYYAESQLAKMDDSIAASQKLFLFDDLYGGVTVATANMAKTNPNLCLRPDPSASPGMPASFYAKLSGSASNPTNGFRTGLNTRLNSKVSTFTGLAPGSYTQAALNALTTAQASEIVGERLTPVPTTLPEAEVIFRHLGRGYALCAFTISPYDGLAQLHVEGAADLISGLASVKYFYFKAPARLFALYIGTQQGGGNQLTVSDSVNHFTTEVNGWMTHEMWFELNQTATAYQTQAGVVAQTYPNVSTYKCAAITPIMFDQTWDGVGNVPLYPAAYGYTGQALSFTVQTGTLTGAMLCAQTPSADMASVLSTLGLVANSPYNTLSQDMSVPIGESQFSRWLLAGPAGSTGFSNTIRTLNVTASPPVVQSTVGPTAFIIPNTSVANIAQAYLLEAQAGPTKTSAQQALDSVVSDPDGYLLCVVGLDPVILAGADILSCKLAQLYTNNLRVGDPAFMAIPLASGDTMQTLADRVDASSGVTALGRFISGVASTASLDLHTAIGDPTTTMVVTLAGSAFTAVVTNGTTTFPTVTDIDEIQMYVNLGVATTYVGTTAGALAAAAVTSSAQAVAAVVLANPTDYTLDMTELMGTSAPFLTDITDPDVALRVKWMLLATCGNQITGLITASLKQLVSD